MITSTQQCTNVKHKNEDIIGICTNIHCDFEKKICKLCLEDSHHNHQTDIIKTNEIRNYSKMSNYLIVSLKSQYEGLQKLCEHILQGIKQSLQYFDDKIFDEEQKEIDNFIVNLRKNNQFMLKQMIVTESLHKLAFKLGDNIKLTFQQYSNRQNADEFWNQGYKNWRIGQYKESLMQFDLALLQDQNHFNSLYWKSSLLLNHFDDPVNAKPIIKQALELKPDDRFLQALQLECASRLDK